MQQRDVCYDARTGSVSSRLSISSVHTSERLVSRECEGEASPRGCPLRRAKTSCGVINEAAAKPCQLRGKVFSPHLQLRVFCKRSVLRAIRGPHELK